MGDLSVSLASEPTSIDPTVDDTEALWRRLFPDWLVKEINGNVRVSSVAFIDRRSGEVSVHRARYSTTDRALQNHPTHSLAEILADVPRKLGHDVVADPTEDDPSHTLITPPAGSSSGRRKKDAKRMAQASRLIVSR